MTLEGTNTYLVGSDPVWVIDPGPADPSHIEAIREAAAARGGIAGVLLTHSHLDHTEGVQMLGAEVAWAGDPPTDEAAALMAAAGALGVTATVAAELGPESRVGPFRVVPTPGHARDHVAFVFDPLDPAGTRSDERVCFCGDLILGRGSSIVPPRAGGGSLADYMASLERVAALGAALLAPGHGPWIEDPEAKIGEYREHRRTREHALKAALEAGERSRQALLDTAWADVISELRPAAALAMQAHLEKLAGDGIDLDGLRQ